MSARGRGGRGGRQNSSFGRGRGFTARGGRGREMEGPPSFVVELGAFLHACEDEMVYKSTNDKVPYFNAGAYLENKTKIGKVDEILGCINDVMFTVKPDAGIVANSFKSGDKVYISPDKLLPLSRFIDQGKSSGGGRGGRGGGRGGRGAGRGRGFTGGRGRSGGRGFSGNGGRGFNGGRGGRFGGGRSGGRSFGRY